MAPNELKAYLKLAADLIWNETQWARKFPEQSLNRIVQIADCLPDLKPLPTRIQPKRK